MHRSRIQRSRDSIRVRREHGRYLVVHTGKVTEKEYLEFIKEQLHNGTLVLKFGKTLQECVQIAIKEGYKAKLGGDPFDEIFIVDDIDEHPLKQVLGLTAQFEDADLPIMIIFSKPCIEVWLLCYVDKVSSEASTITGAQRLAKKYGLVCGHHNKHINRVALQDHEKALKVAKRIRRAFGDDVLTCAPTTDMDLLVEKLLQEKKT